MLLPVHWNWPQLHVLQLHLWFILFLCTFSKMPLSLFIILYSEWNVNFILDASGMIKFWHYTSQRCLHTIKEARQTLSAALNPSGSKFVTVGASPQIFLYDVESRQKMATLEPRYFTCCKVDIAMHDASICHLSPLLSFSIPSYPSSLLPTCICSRGTSHTAKTQILSMRDFWKDYRGLLTGSTGIWGPMM